MRSLHTVEEKLYGPGIAISGTAMKVLLFIRHETIRWETEESEITYSDIMHKTGIHERRAKEAIKVLEKKKLIIVSRRNKARKDFPNIIGLNPAIFGEIVEPTCRPKMSVIMGGKQEKLSTGVLESAPLNTKIRTPLYHNPHPSGGLQEPLEPVFGPLNNSLNNSILKNATIEESFTQEKWDPEGPKKVREILKSIIGTR